MTYAVAYALNLTMAFVLLMQNQAVEPRTSDKWWQQGYRIDSEVLDAVISLTFSSCALLACVDSAWGMLLCCEWGVRSMAVPATLYETFARELDPSGRPEHAGNAMWVLRIFEPRLPHFGQPRKGLFTDEPAGQGIGFTQNAAWDPFYFIDRTVQMQFLAVTCLLYLYQGPLHSVAAFVAMGVLYQRVRTHATPIVNSMFATLMAAEKVNPNGVLGRRNASAVPLPRAANSPAQAPPSVRADPRPPTLERVGSAVLRASGFKQGLSTVDTAVPVESTSA